MRFRALLLFFNWMVAEDIIAVSPMRNMAAPAAPEQPVPMLSDDELSALLRVTRGKGFEQRPDHAIILVFIDGEGWSRAAQPRSDVPAV